jgi:23S rRNA C2498 (ribose-2'-O)-methylase RlmM
MLRSVLLLVSIVSVVANQEGEITSKLVQWTRNGACSNDILNLIASGHFKESKIFETIQSF